MNNIPMLGHMGQTQNIHNLPSLSLSAVVLCAMQPALCPLPPVTFLGGENLMKNLGLPRRTYYVVVVPSRWGIFPITMSLRVRRGWKSIAAPAGVR